MIILIIFVVTNYFAIMKEKRDIFLQIICCIHTCGLILPMQLQFWQLVKLPVYFVLFEF